MLRNPIVQALIFVTVTYWAAALSPWAHNRRIIEFVDGPLIGALFAIMLVYGRKMLQILRNPYPDKFETMLVGIAGLGFVNGVDRGLRLTSRTFDWPELIVTPFLGYILVLMTVFACCHLAVRGVINEGPITAAASPQAWGTIIAALLWGAALGALAVTIDRAVYPDTIVIRFAFDNLILASGLGP